MKLITALKNLDIYDGWIASLAILSYILVKISPYHFFNDYLNIEDAIKAKDLLYIVISTLSTILGLFIGFLVLSFQISINRFGRYAISYFRNNKALKRLLALLVVTLLISFFEYNTRIYARNQLGVTYLICIFCGLILISIVPTIFALFTSITSNDFQFAEISKIESWELQEKEGKSTIDEHLFKVITICTQEIKAGETASAIGIIERLCETHHAKITERAATIDIIALSKSIHSEIEFLSAFVWENVIETSIAENDGQTPLSMLQNINSYIIFLIRLKVDFKCVSQIFSKLWDINELFISREYHSILDNEFTLLNDFFRTVIIVGKDIKDFFYNPDEDQSTFKRHFHTTLDPILMQINILYFIIIQNLNQKNEFSRSAKAITEYSKLIYRIADLPLEDRKKYDWQWKMIDSYVDMVIANMDRLGPLKDWAFGFDKMPSQLFEVMIDDPEIFFKVQTLCEYGDKLSKNGLIDFGATSTVEKMKEIAIEIFLNLNDNIRRNALLIYIFNSFLSIGSSMNGQPDAIEKLTKYCDEVLDKIASQNTLNRLDYLNTDLRLIRNRIIRLGQAYNNNPLLGK